jgi:hypothetical protein
MQTVMEILSKEMAIDVEKVLNSFYSLLKKPLSIEPSALSSLNGLISDELIENLKKHGFSYPILKFRFPTNNDVYIILKGNKVYGSKNWRDYKEPSLFDELSSL